MYEYAVETATVKDAEEIMNEMAKKGWRRVLSVVAPNLISGYGLVITFERQIRR